MHAAGDVLWIHISSENSITDLQVWMNTTLNTLDQLSFGCDEFFWQRQLNNSVNVVSGEGYGSGTKRTKHVRKDRNEKH